jgi:type II secretory pathway pseudopilin PulG
MMELMVVVIIVAILAALAIPSVVKARDDRRAYNDAAALSLLLRSARLRAIGRGAAVAVHITANGATDRGTALVYEGVTDNPVATPSTAAQQYPQSSCINTTWTAAASSGTAPLAAYLVDGLNFNGTLESTINLLTVVDVRTSGGYTTNATNYWICYTPTGNAYAAAGGGTGPAFSNANLFVDMDICVGRYKAGATPADCTSAANRPIGPWRHVLVPPTGVARMYSK